MDGSTSLVEALLHGGNGGAAICVGGKIGDGLTSTQFAWKGSAICVANGCENDATYSCETLGRKDGNAVGPHTRALASASAGA